MLARSIGIEVVLELGELGARGMCASGSEDKETGWRRGVVVAGVPAGERVTAGMSDTRRLWPRLGVLAPRLGEVAAGTGSLSAADRSIEYEGAGAEVLEAAAEASAIGLSRLDLLVVVAAAGALIITVITLPSLIS